MRKIKSIQTALNEDNQFIQVGQYGVTSIEDLTWEGDNQILPVYEILKDNKVYMRIENIPVIIHYFE